MKKLLLLSPLLLSACASWLDARVQMDPPPVVNLPDQQATAPLTGGIHQSASYRPLFEQHRARLVGDTLTIAITERISASQSSSSQAERTGSLSAGVTAVPGINPNSFGRASAAWEIFKDFLRLLIRKPIGARIAPPSRTTSSQRIDYLVSFSDQQFTNFSKNYNDLLPSFSNVTNTRQAVSGRQCIGRPAP